MASFLRDINDLPDPNEDNAKPIIVPQLTAHGAVIVVVMYTPNGTRAGEVMRDSFAHRKLLAGGFYEVDEAQS